MNRDIWYRDKDSLQLGGVTRYVVRYTHTDLDVGDTGSAGVTARTAPVYFRLKNTENASIRAIHLLNGPFTLYCHVVPCNYQHKKEYVPQNDMDSQEVVFDNEIKPGQTFNVPLILNSNSLRETLAGGSNVYEWSIDIISQIVITTYTYIEYDFMVGDNLDIMKKVNHGPLNSGTMPFTRLASGFSPTYSSNHSEGGLNNKYSRDSIPKLATSLNPLLEVTKKTAKELWNTKPPDPKSPVHLIIITHGIFSNTYADMLYLKEEIESNLGQNVLVRGYLGNAGHTERGVKRLGIAVAEYVLEIIPELQKQYSIDKISFIGHSLGGVVQLYAMKYILWSEGEDYFRKQSIIPEHLICMATPLLGVLNEMSFWISWFLDIGALGKTGRDLTLLKKIPTIKDIKMSRALTNTKGHHHNYHYLPRDNFKPLLETLPNDPLQLFLKQFSHLTLYANAVNDGIVPLRTSSLLYLDWEALGDVGGIKAEEKKGVHNTTKDEKDGRQSQLSDSEHDEEDVETVGGGQVGEEVDDAGENQISIGEVPNDDEDTQTSKLKEGKKSFKPKSHISKYLELMALNVNIKPSKKTKRKISRRERKFMMISAKGIDPLEKENDANISSTPTNESRDVSSDGEYYPQLNIPPKASAIESALNTLLCPIPSPKYVINPESRPSIIFHDKFYSFLNIPQTTHVSRRNRIGEILFKYHDSKAEKQVKIAQKYHDGLTWRKVLVHLPPDAHNNIVVRRRFANGYGWGVVDHIVHLFQEDIGAKKTKLKM